MQILQEALLVALQESIDVTMQEDTKALLPPFASKITLDLEAFVIVMNRELLLRFASDFLNENNPDEIVLIDIAKEVTNLIIGKAKVLYEEKGRILKLGIPESFDNDRVESYKKALHFRHGNMRCSIYKL